MCAFAFILQYLNSVNVECKFVLLLTGMVLELVEALSILYEKCHLRSQNKRLALNHLAQLTVLQHNQSNKSLLE